MKFQASFGGNMTFSLLVRDAENGEMGAAAATGAYCVGGWVLRGRFDSGLSASQGAAPSTFWGDNVLDGMRAGQSATEALQETIAPDDNRNWRQLAALDRQGVAAAHSGNCNTDWCGHILQRGSVAAGNILSGRHVLEELLTTYEGSKDGMANKLVMALRAAQKAGGDKRGLQSAALLVLAPDRPPLSLRIDMSRTPLDDLADLTKAVHERVGAKSYANWTQAVPVPDDPYRADNAILSEDSN